MFANSPPRTPSPHPEQSHRDGWTVLKEPHSSPTHDSNDSNDSDPDEEHVPVARNKRKANKSPVASSRAAKSPKVSGSTESPGAARLPTQTRHSLGSVRELNSRAGPSSINFTSNGIIRTTISKSQPKVFGSQPLPEKRNFPPLKTNRPSSSLNLVQPLRQGTSSSRSALKAKHVGGGDSSSSDSLPDPLALLGGLFNKTAENRKLDKVSGKGKERAFGGNASVHKGSKVASSSFPAQNSKHPSNDISQRKFLTKPQPSAPSAANDNDTIIISSDSDSNPQPPRGILPKGRTEKQGKSKGKTSKAFLSDSDGAIDLTSDAGVSKVTKLESSKGSEANSGDKGPTKSTQFSAPGALKNGPHKSSSVEPKSSGMSSRDTNMQTPRSAPVPSEAGPSNSVAPLAKSTNVGISTSTSALLTTGNKSEIPSTQIRYSLPGPSLRPGQWVSTGKGASTSKRNDGPAANVEVIDLCSDSDEAMEVDDILAAGSEAADTRASPDTAPSISGPGSPNPPRRYTLPWPLPSLLVPSPQTEPPQLSSSADHSPSRSTGGLSTSGGSERLEASVGDMALAMSLPQAFVAVDAIFADRPPSAPASVTDGQQQTGSVPPSSSPAEDALPTDSGIRSEGSRLESRHDRSSPVTVVTRDGSVKNSVSRETGASHSNFPQPQNAEAGPSRLSATSRVSSNVSYRTSTPDATKDALRSPADLAESLVAPVSEMHLQMEVDVTRDDSSPDPLGDFDPVDETMDVDTPARSIIQDAPSERASPVSTSLPLASSGREGSKSSGTSSVLGSSNSSGPSIQHARKTTGKPPGMEGSEGGLDSDLSGRDDFQAHEDEEHQPNMTPSRRLISVKEPDFSTLRADDPNALDDAGPTGSLSDAIQWPAERIPTELHDMLNHLPANYHHNPQMKYIFESMMEENTAEDEPTSPRIELYSGQNGPVCPPWEFYYTNRIFYGKGVPRSDKKQLRGCDCDGPCDPTSKTCACVKRQMAWTGGDKDIKGFLYNKKGKILHPGYPIFECNEACECSEECMNRVIQNGRQHQISICLTKGKGWGVYADDKIPRGTYLGIYAGEMLLESEAGERGKLYDKYGRTYLFDLDFYYLHSLEMDKQKIQMSQGSVNDKDDEKSSLYTIDAFHVGNFTRFLNHSCDPNCVITPSYVNEPDLQKPTLTIFTTRDVKKGEELCFSYFGNDDDEEEEEEDEHGQTKKVVGGPGTHTTTKAIHRPCLCGTAKCRGKMF